MRPVAWTAPHLDLVDLAEDHGTDRLLVEVEGDTERAAFELEELVDGDVGQAADAGDAVADLDHTTDLGAAQLGAEAGEARAEGGGDVVRVDREVRHLGFLS